MGTRAHVDPLITGTETPVIAQGVHTREVSETEVRARTQEDCVHVEIVTKKVARQKLCNLEKHGAFFLAPDTQLCATNAQFKTPNRLARPKYSPRPQFPPFVNTTQFHTIQKATNAVPVAQFTTIAHQESLSNV